MLYDRDGSGECKLFRGNPFTLSSFLGSITREEMKLIFVMMLEEPQHKELEPTEYKLAIKEIERKADDMFVELDADGDGFLTEVRSRIVKFINLLNSGSLYIKLFLFYQSVCYFIM